MHRRRSLLISSLAVLALAATACGRQASPAAGGPARTPTAPVSPPPHVLITPHTTSSAARSTGSWGASSTAAHGGKKGGKKGGNLWSGAGRHPEWRGCVHTYDPTLTAFIFGKAASPSPAA